MQYIKRVNTIEAIQNKGDILNNVIPFLNNHGIAFKYTDSFIEGKQISVMLHKRECTTLNLDEYLVINKGVISIMSAEEFESKYQEDDSVGSKCINNEHTEKQPHIRIEFDDIHDAPKVWVDGERDYDYCNKHTVIILRKY